MNNEMKDNTINNPIQPKKESNRNFYKINIIKAEENKVKDEEDNVKKELNKSFRKTKSLNSAKNILQYSIRSKRGSELCENKQNEQQPKKNLFAQVRKSNINNLHNKSIIFQGKSSANKNKQYYKYNSHKNTNHFLELIRFTNNLYNKKKSFSRNNLLQNIENNESLKNKSILEKNESKEKLIRLQSLKNEFKKQLSLNLIMNKKMRKSAKSSKFVTKNKNEKEKEEKSQNNSSSINQSITAYYKGIGNSSKQSLFFIPDKNNKNDNLDYQAINNKKEVDKNNNDKLIMDNKKDINNKDLKNNNNIIKNKKKENNEKDNDKKDEKQINNLNIIIYNKKNKEKEKKLKRNDKEEKNEKKKNMNQKNNNDNVEKQTNYSNKKINKIENKNDNQIDEIKNTKKKN
jgi:hypothetical protein